MGTYSADVTITVYDTFVQYLSMAGWRNLGLGKRSLWLRRIHRVSLTISQGHNLKSLQQMIRIQNISIASEIRLFGRATNTVEVVETHCEATEKDKG